MAGNNIHSQIIDSAEIHVPKGFTEADNYTGPIKNSVGQLEWRDLDQLGKQNNFTATVDPTSIDDAAHGYSVGSRWVNITQRNAFTCVDATTNAAVWRVTIRNNPNAIIDPTVNDDASKGYVPGSVWINVADGRETWMCTDNLIGYAEWKSLTTPDIVGLDHRTLSHLESDDHLQYLNRSGVRPMTGDLDMDGHSISNAVQYNGVKLPEANIARVRKDPGDNEYGSIADALADITTASISNPWVVDVGAGVFSEPQLVMKPFVSILGRGYEATVIQALDPSDHLIVGAGMAAVRGVTVSGVSDTGKAGIYYNGSIVFEVDNVISTNNAIGILFEGAATGTPVIVRNTIVTGVFQVGIRTASTGGNSISALIDGCSVEGPLADPSALSIDISGSNNITLLRDLVISGNGTSSGVSFSNGAALKISSANMRNLGIGVSNPSTGAAPSIDASAINFSNCAQEIDLQNVGTTGALVFFGDQSKYYSASNMLALQLLDKVTSDLIFSGKLRVLQSDQTIEDLSTLIVETATMGIEEGGDLSVNTGLTINLTAGFGYIEIEPELIRRFDWPDQIVAFPPNAVRYLYFDPSGTLTQNATSPDTAYNILLGRVVTGASSIILIDDIAMIAEHTSNRYDRMFREAFGPIYKSGSSVTENGTRQLDVTAGQYFVSSCEYTPVGGTALSWTSVRGNGSGGFILGSQNTVDNATYDDGSGSLAPLTAGYWAKHSFYTIGESTNEKYFLVYSQAEYSALTLAQQASIPTPPSYFTEGVTLIASIIVQQGATNIVEIRDERPRIGFTASGVSATTFHSNLLGLTVGDDHPQYWRNDGTHVASGNWNMGGNSISNIGTLNSVTIENHKARHQPGGADAIPTAAAITQNPDQANAEGSSTSLSRADHTHQIPTATAVTLSGDTTNTQGNSTSFSRANHTHAITTGIVSTQTPDQSNAEGTAAALSRIDHAHNIPTATAVGMNANSTNQQGVAATFSRSDHVHFILSGTPSTQNPDQTNTTGTATGFARADHIHQIPTATAVGMNANTANAQGVSTSFSRADHAHAIASGAAAAQAPDQANAAGTSTNFARADHVHNIPTEAATTINANSANTQGAAATFARSDHTHAISTGAASSQSPDQVNGIGISANLARADHVHNIPTATAVSLDAASTNTQGVGVSFARNDHTHAIGTALVGDITTIQPDATASAGTSNNYARGDHRHAIDAAAPSSNLTATTTNAEGASTSFARADHSHAITTGAASTQTPDQANATGSSANVARADHVHNIPTAAASSIDTSSTNTQGAAATFARADHTHATSVLSQQVTATADITTTSGTDVLMTTMTITPTAGTYLAMFSGSVETSSNNADVFVNLYVGGSILAHTERQATNANSGFGASAAGTCFPIATQSIVTVNGSQAVEARWRRSAGTATSHERTLTLIRLSN